MKRYLPHVARLLLALPFAVSGLNKLLHLFAQTPPTPEAGALMSALHHSGYLLPLIGLTEVAVAAALIANRFVPLALVLLAPVMVNIVGFHLFLAPAGMPVVIVLTALGLYLAWHHRAAYLPLLRARTSPVAEPEGATLPAGAATAR